MQQRSNAAIDKWLQSMPNHAGAFVSAGVLVIIMAIVAQQTKKPAILLLTVVFIAIHWTLKAQRSGISPSHLWS